MHYPTTCIHKISYLSNQSSYNHLLLHFIHFKFTEVLERALLSNRRVDYNHNDVFKRIASPVVFIEAFVIGWDTGTLAPYWWRSTNDAFGWLRWFEMVWRPSCCNFLFPAGFPAREYSASGLGFKCPEISDLRGSAGTFGPEILQTQSTDCGILAEKKHWNKDGKLRKVWSYRKPHMGSPGQRWTPPCFLVIQYF